MPSLKPMWDQRRLSTPSTPRGHQDASASATTATAQTPVRRPYTAWRGPTSNESRQPWQSQPLTPSKSRPYTAPLGSAAIAYGRACSRPLTGADGSHAARLPLPSAASHRDIVELRSRQSFPGPIRLRTPSAELRALDEAYDRRQRTSPTRPMTGRRARSAAYFGRDGAARSIATGDGRAAPVAVAASAGAAPSVRRIGGASTLGRERTRAPKVMIDPQLQLRELQELARAWAGAPGARTSRGRYAATEILNLTNVDWTC